MPNRNAVWKEAWVWFFTALCLVCNPWNLGTAVADKTSPRDKFRDHAGFTGFVPSVLTPETGNQQEYFQQEIKPSISAFKVMSPLPSASDGSRWATHPGSPYNHCWGRGIPRAWFMSAVSQAGSRRRWKALLHSATCEGRLSMSAAEEGVWLSLTENLAHMFSCFPWSS